jgi:hypothetical protein
MYINPETVNSALLVPVKSTGVHLILVMPRTKKSWKIWLTEYMYPGLGTKFSTRSGIHHACMRSSCMRCSVGLDLRCMHARVHACMLECRNELASIPVHCLKGAASREGRRRLSLCWKSSWILTKVFTGFLLIYWIVNFIGMHVPRFEKNKSTHNKFSTY